MPAPLPTLAPVLSVDARCLGCYSQIISRRRALSKITWRGFLALLKGLQAIIAAAGTQNIGS